MFYSPTFIHDYKAMCCLSCEEVDFVKRPAEEACNVLLEERFRNEGYTPGRTSIY
jgi:hypothetical protein